MTRIITARADEVSGAEFLRALRGDPNDISRFDQAGGYYFNGEGWMKIRPHHVGIKDQLTEVHGDPLRKVA